MTIMEYDEDFREYDNANIEENETGCACIKEKLPVFRISIPRNVINEYGHLLECAGLLKGLIGLF